MFKTIFAKHICLYICLYISIMTISFTMLGTSLSQFYKSYFIDRQEKALIDQGDKISKLIISNLYVKHNGEVVVNLNLQIREEVRILSEYLDSDFLISSNDFKILYDNNSNLENQEIDVINMPIFNNLKEGKIVSTEGTLGGIYQESKLTVAYPVVASGNTIGVIFMSSSMDMLKASISEVARITTVCVIVSGVFAFILIYFSSKSMSKPLQQMNDAAKVIASGDFEKRIEITGIDEVGQLAENFNNMANSLYKQENTRREFIANISHDLRSPLTSIIGFLQAIKDGTIPEEKRDRYLTIVLDECTRLSKLANDLLDISKFQIIGDVDIMTEEFDINELIRNVLLQFENRFKDKNIVLEIVFANEKDMVIADYDKIRRVFNNLVDNAIKFTPADGQIVIESSEKENKVYISVKDSGKGMAEDEKKHIFERFYKADISRGRDKAGSGLGLAIVNEFVKAHNEKIYVNSNIGLGSEFIFTLSKGENKPNS